MIDAAKSAVEKFLSYERKRNNRYLLATTDSSNPLKTVLDTDIDGLISKLKFLQAVDLSDVGNAFGKVFECLNAHAGSLGMNLPGGGRYLAIQETTIIFFLTDGSKYTVPSQAKAAKLVDIEFSIPSLKTAGSEFYVEPFRWEQRLYTIHLETPNHPPQA